MFKKVVITGARRVGKTTLINEVYNALNKNKVLCIPELALDMVEKFNYMEAWDFDRISEFDRKQYYDFEMMLYHYLNFVYRLPSHFVCDGIQLGSLAFIKNRCGEELFEDLFIDFMDKEKEYIRNNIKIYCYLGAIDDIGEKVERFLVEKLNKHFLNNTVFFERKDYSNIKLQIMKEFDGYKITD